MPSNVYIRGESISASVLFLKESNCSGSKEQRIKQDYVFRGADPRAQRWGVSDLTLYATSYYGDIFVDDLIDAFGDSGAVEVPVASSSVSLEDYFTDQVAIVITIVLTVAGERGNKNHNIKSNQLRL